MAKTISHIIFLLLVTLRIAAQERDTNYIAEYPQKIILTGFTTVNTLFLQNDDTEYAPNNPFSVGIGIGIKNTVVNLRLSTNVADLKSNKYGKTDITDFQIHSYGKKMIFDVYIQDYEGFYTDEKNPKLFPDMGIMQIGAEAGYILNNSRFSARAAFAQREKQLRSAGSWIIGGGAYYYKLRFDDSVNPARNTENVQFGINAGYAYTWIFNSPWMLSGMVMAGGNMGNTPENLKKALLKIYPTAIARGSATYQKNDWALAFSMLINNKYLYIRDESSFSLTAFSMQLSYTKRLDGFRKKKSMAFDLRKR